MGNSIFQPPAGLAWEIKKRPRYSSLTTNTFSGKGQIRLAKQIFPIWEYEMNWDYLTGSEQSATGANAGLQQLMGFFMAKQGSFDSFLFSDPNDNSVTAEQFGTGDGTSTAFQLSRFIGGGFDIVQNVNQSVSKPNIYKYDWQGTKNLLSQSEDISASPWATNSNVIPVPIVTPNAGFAPDGSNNAVKISFGAPNGNGGNWSGWAQPNVGYAVAGRTFTFSIWLRADVAYQSSALLMILESTPTFANGSLAPAITTQWQRFTVTATFAGGNTDLAINVHLRLKANAVSAPVIYAWGAQLEENAGATTYQKTGVNNWGPLFQASSLARKNWVLQSNGFDQTAWNKTNMSVTPNATTAPDGSNNGVKLAAIATATTSCNQVVNGSGFAAANTYSIFVKKGSGATQANSFVLRNAATSTNLLNVTVNYDTGAITYITGSTGVTMYKLPNGWWRLSMTATSGISNGDNIQVYSGFIGNSETAGVFCYVFGAQLEQYGFNALSTTPYPCAASGAGGSAYIPTTSATVTVTDYSLGTTGIVTFANAPASNALLTWDGSYYYRLHFAEDINEFNNFMNQLWELQSVKFESVILSDNSTTG